MLAWYILETLHGLFNLKTSCEVHKLCFIFTIITINFFELYLTLSNKFPKMNHFEYDIPKALVFHTKFLLSVLNLIKYLYFFYSICFLLHFNQNNRHNSMSQFLKDCSFLLTVFCCKWFPKWIFKKMMLSRKKITQILTAMHYEINFKK